MPREEFARHYSLCEQAEAEVFAEIADDYSAAETVAGGAWLHSQLGASIDSDEERAIVRRGRQIWYAAIVAKDTILSQAVIHRWAMSR